MCHAPEIQFGRGEAGRAVMPPLGIPAQTQFALAVSGQAIQNITAICAVPETADCLCSGMSGPCRRDERFCGNSMSKPIADKAEITLEYPDKLYIGTFGSSSRFEAHIDAA